MVYFFKSVFQVFSFHEVKVLQLIKSLNAAQVSLPHFSVFQQPERELVSSFSELEHVIEPPASEDHNRAADHPGNIEHRS